MYGIKTQWYFYRILLVGNSIVVARFIWLAELHTSRSCGCNSHALHCYAMLLCSGNIFVLAYYTWLATINTGASDCQNTTFRWSSRIRNHVWRIIIFSLLRCFQLVMFTSWRWFYGVETYSRFYKNKHHTSFWPFHIHQRPSTVGSARFLV